MTSLSELEARLAALRNPSQPPVSQTLSLEQRVSELQAPARPATLSEMESRFALIGGRPTLPVAAPSVASLGVSLGSCVPVGLPVQHVSAPPPSTIAAEDELFEELMSEAMIAAGPSGRAQILQQKQPTFAASAAVAPGATAEDALFAQLYSEAMAAKKDASVIAARARPGIQAAAYHADTLGIQWEGMPSHEEVAAIMEEALSEARITAGAPDAAVSSTPPTSHHTAHHHKHIKGVRRQHGRRRSYSGSSFDVSSDESSSDSDQYSD